MSFVWTPALSVGVDSIDAQHRELFRRVNALLVAVGGDREEQEILRTLAFLGNYVVGHFGDEELLMRETMYPGIALHLSLHARFDETFSSLRARFARQGMEATFATEVRTEVCDWLVQHVQGTDRALGEWLAARGLAQHALGASTTP